MKASIRTPVETETVGIVISVGSHAEPAPRFSAYLWEAPPELESDAANRAA